MQENEPGLDATRLIEAAYEVILLRATDPAGLDHWRTEINSGRVTLTDFFLTLMTSTEFQDKAPMFVEKYLNFSNRLLKSPH
jgi:hypothetical protein